MRRHLYTITLGEIKVKIRAWNREMERLERQREYQLELVRIQIYFDQLGNPNLETKPDSPKDVFPIGKKEQKEYDEAHPRVQPDNFSDEYIERIKKLGYTIINPLKDE